MRAIIRDDLDGIVCAALLKVAGAVDQVRMARVKEIVDGDVEITDQDIVCNLPYHPDANLWFHHSNEGGTKYPVPSDLRGAYAMAPSTSRLIYQHYHPNHSELQRFSGLVDDTDRVASADLSMDDVRDPQGNILLGLLLDPRTGLAAHSDHRSEYLAWKASVPDLLIQHTTAEILAMPEAQSWEQIYQESQEAAVRELQDASHRDNNVIVSDFRGMSRHPVSRFILYTLPGLSDGNVSVQISDGDPGVYDEIAVGHSIFNRTASVDVGDLCSWYGGGGIRSAGVCRPSSEESDQVFREIIEACKEANGS